MAVLKYVLIIADGMADRPLSELGGKTPLQAAHTPCLDALSAAGTVGHSQTVPEGLPVGSDTAILSILGCDPLHYYKGRGALEAAGAAIPVQAGEVVYRGNFVSLEEGEDGFESCRLISHNAEVVSREEGTAFFERLSASEKFQAVCRAAKLRLYPVGGYQLLAVSDAKNAPQTLSPPHDHLGETIVSLLPPEPLLGVLKAAHELFLCDPLNTARKEKGLPPINGIWLWGAGERTELPQFLQIYGKRGGVISAVPICRGIAALMGMDEIPARGMTGTVDTNFEAKAESALDYLCNGGDVAVIHVEAPDACSHNGDAAGKVRAIERMDERLLQPLLRGLHTGSMADFRLLLLSDHETLTETRGHGSGIVPCLLYDSREELQSAQPFDEEIGRRGPHLGAGVDLLKKLFEQE